MRVAVLTPYTTPHIGGITSYTAELARSYHDLGHQVMGLAAEGEDSEMFRVLGGSKLRFCVRASLALLSWKPDLVHSHSHWYLLAPGVVMRILRRKTRLVFTFHTPWLDGRTTVRFALLTFLLHFATVVSFVSQDTRRSLSLPASIRQSVILAAPEGVAVRQTPGAIGSPRNPTVIFVGPLVWPNKVAGLYLLLEAFAKVSGSFPDWRLFIFGDGPLRKELEERARALGVQDVVTLKGWSDNPQSEMQVAEIYAQITRQEGLSLSLLNAMAMGLPVLATNVGGNPEVVADSVNGYLVPPLTESISTALTKLMGNPSLRRKLGKAAQLAATQRDWKMVASDFLQASGVLRDG